MMKPKILKTEEDYNRALAQVLDFNAPTPGTPEGDAFELLLLLIEDYEAKNVPPIPDPHPIAAIQYYMEEQGLKPTDLGSVLNSKSHASEILNLKRPLSLQHVRRISSAWNLPAEVLIKSYAVAEDAEGYSKRVKRSGK